MPRTGYRWLGLVHAGHPREDAERLLAILPPQKFLATHEGSHLRRWRRHPAASLRTPPQPEAFMRYFQPAPETTTPTTTATAFPRTRAARAGSLPAARALPAGRSLLLTGGPRR